MAASISITVNEQKHTLETDPQRPLLQVLREDLGLTGPKYGCGEAHCGACSVLIDGKRVFSCVTSVQDVADKSITTIEGLAQKDKLHPVQQAFLDEGAFQCGYCTSGMIINAVALLNDKPKPTEGDIITWMNGNLCRCCGYTKILKAIQRAAAAMGGK